MLIQTDRLKSTPLLIEIDEDVSGFPALNELLTQESVEISGSIKGVARVVRVGRIVEVDGNLSAQLVSSCGRCLSPVQVPLSVTFSLSYTENNDKPDTGHAEEVELTEDDLGLIPYGGQEIDLRSDLDQELIMALPQQLVCDEGCKGLCPACGENLNLVQCRCEPPVFHPGLAALKNLKID